MGTTTESSISNAKWAYKDIIKPVGKGIYKKGLKPGYKKILKPAVKSGIHIIKKKYKEYDQYYKD